MGVGGWDGKKQGPGWVCIDLVLLADSTATDVTVNVRGKTWPPKL